jgi:predicted aspartyl protease
VLEAFTLKHVEGRWDKINLAVTVTNPANRLSFDVQARLDTGCNVTSITKRLARTLSFVPLRFEMTQTSAGEMQSSIYRATVQLQNGITFPNMIIGEFMERKISGQRKAKPEDDFDVLIGMDIITAGDLAITDDAGNTIVSYRKPHGPFIDFQNDGYAKAESDWVSGINGTKRDIARNFKGMGIPLDQIAQGTGLSIAEIQRL